MEACQAHVAELAPSFVRLHAEADVVTGLGLLGNLMVHFHIEHFANASASSEPSISIL